MHTQRILWQTWVGWVGWWGVITFCSLEHPADATLTVHAHAEDSLGNMGRKEIHAQGIVLQTCWQSQLEPKGSRVHLQLRLATSAIWPEIVSEYGMKLQVRVFSCVWEKTTRELTIVNA